MPNLSDVVGVLNRYRGRYECLDAFVDDIDELRLNLPLAPGTRPITQGPHPIIETWVANQAVRMDLFPDRGIARFRLTDGTGRPPAGESIAAGAALGGTLGAALGAASEQKGNGLLGGLVLGVLIGGLIGAATSERAVALQFDPVSATWKLYDGHLMTWAKRTLTPAS